ncbi:MAG: hypothetical protein H0W84_11760 [Bacteroidetes bacterium]|nr:hypothetical protein [Bacteroidota bacterium]
MTPTFIKILRKLKYIVYEKPYQLNIFGIRSSETNSNRFDDNLYVFYKNNQSKWIHYMFPVTTDPGTYWLLNPLQVLGTAILKAGQYIDAWSIGLHKGQYKALVQVKPITVIRDYDRNAILDFNNGKEEKGMFGINIHRSSATGSSQSVDKWSAGCQVFQNINDFKMFMKLCEVHKAKNGNHFTYALLDFRMLKRYGRRKLAYIGASVVGAIGLTCLILRFNKLKTRKYV